MDDGISWTEVAGSSNVAAFAYVAGDPEVVLGTLYVRFTSGAEYKYADFPNQLAEDFFQADSVGTFFHVNIRGKYIGFKFYSNEQQDKLEEKLETADETNKGHEKPTDEEAEYCQDDGKALRDEFSDEELAEMASGEGEGQQF